MVQDTLAEAVFSVGEFITFTNALLGQATVTVRGEVTSVSDRGHIYFSLSDKEGQAVLACAIWKSLRNRLAFDIESGMELEIVGHANVYAPSGRFTFLVDRVAPVGEGALRAAFAKLKAKLEAEGFFAPERKRPLPLYPERIGLLTSAQGEALHDFRKHLTPAGIHVVHRDCRVEGIGAVSSIVRGIRWFNEQPDPVELIVLTRGGGSLESLQAYNTLEVAEAIMGSRIPVLAAIGHERDESIADFVADARASTPTHAGRMVTEQWAQAAQQVLSIWSFMLQRLQRQSSGLVRELESQTRERSSRWRHQLMVSQQKVQNISLRFDAARRRPQQLVDRAQKQWDLQAQRWQWMVKEEHKQLEARPVTYAQSWQTARQSIVRLLSQESRFLLQADPQHRLRQGYSIVRGANGKILREKIEVNEEIRVESQFATLTAVTKTVTRKDV